ncbi:endonuclease domain-containing protein [Sphingomonas sp. ID0503]|uniref:endonuclease domain-containing protein n=1 Tax=Sphingomonas sp. ID0503 TaxID=3399691 RepID=UPI003AFB5942
MFKDRSPRPSARAARTSRTRRRDMSLPEVLLWAVLRARPGGLKFRREHPSGDYSIDFYCSDARLAIEVDGEAHARGDRPNRDAARDAWFGSHGIYTMRVPAADILRDLDAVTHGILEKARSRLPLHHPAGGPPPRDKLGED